MVKLKRSLGEFESRVAGIPCRIAVVSYYQGSPTIWSGPLAGPEEPAEADWVILDRKGNVAKWLHNKLTDSDIERIDEEAVEYMGG